MIVSDALSRVDSVLQAAPLPENGEDASPADCSVTLENVSYSYDGKRKALDEVSLQIKAGETVALVGPSGGGKTTLANIISRFFDPQEGRVLIGGVDIRDIPKERLMNTVSFVFQNSRLIKASVLDNVRLSRPNASRREVIAALNAAQCDDIVEKLPMGIDTVIGGGVYLSGGEQQRIAIARAILKDAPIIILDEATAFADPDNEARIQRAMSVLAKGKTAIMIAHRLSSVSGADRICVMKDGRLTESGSIDELIAKDGTFAKMWRQYSASVQWKLAKEGTL